MILPCRLGQPSGLEYKAIPLLEPLESWDYRPRPLFMVNVLEPRLRTTTAINLKNNKSLMNLTSLRNETRPRPRPEGTELFMSYASHVC